MTSVERECRISIAVEMARFEYVDPRDPAPWRQGVFVLHNCYRCRHGAKACVHGDPARCENLHVRND